jgi:hypothetical protein
MGDDYGVARGVRSGWGGGTKVVGENLPSVLWYGEVSANCVSYATAVVRPLTCAKIVRDVTAFLAALISSSSESPRI